MTDKQVIGTDEEPLEQRNVLELIRRGYSLDLLIEHKISNNTNQYYLYAKYRGHLRPIYTQRNRHRSYKNLELAIDWGKRIGFKSLALKINYDNYIEVKPLDKISEAV